MKGNLRSILPILTFGLIGGPAAVAWPVHEVTGGPTVPDRIRPPADKPRKRRNERAGGGGHYGMSIKPCAFAPKQAKHLSRKRYGRSKAQRALRQR